MKNGNKNEFDIAIEKSENATVVRISKIKPDDFDEAYVLACKIMNRAKALDSKIQQLDHVENLREVLSPLWIIKTDGNVISDLVSQNSHRIALSLLQSYPESKLESEIVRETGIARGTVNFQLSGKVKSVNDYFDRKDAGYTLTEAGLSWISNEIVPFLQKKESILH